MKSDHSGPSDSQLFRHALHLNHHADQTPQLIRLTGAQKSQLIMALMIKIKIIIIITADEI